MTFPLMRKQPPVCPVHTTQREVHGVLLRDDYAWLRAENWQAAIREPDLLPDEIKAYLEAENAYSKTALRPLSKLKSAIYREMKERTEEDTVSVPMADGPYDYYDRFGTGDEYPILCRKLRMDDAEQVLLDANKEARGKAYFDLGAAQHCPAHRFLAWSADDKGNELYTITVRDMQTGVDLADTVPDSEGNAVWQNDSQAFYYVKLDANHRPSMVYQHRLGSHAASDRLVYEESDPTFFFGIHRANAGDVAFLGGHESDMSEIYTLDLADVAAQPMLIAPRLAENQYWAEYHPDYNGERTLFIRTNLDGAEDYCIMTAPLANPDRPHWRPLIAHRPGVMILSIYLFRDWLVRIERENALPRIVVRELATGEEHIIAFAEEAYALFIDEGYEFATDTVRFVYASMTTPQETWDYDMRSRTRLLRKRQVVPSGHDPADYVTERCFATASDGERIPVSLLYKKDLKRDGSAPLLLYGYGSYGLAMPARFATGRLSLVDRGFIYAIAHIRGGSEKGDHWYKAGKLAQKQNTFTDFIACAEHLISKGYCDKNRIVAHGGSAGGMLMGAIANMRPDLWAGIVAEVPFVDVLNTILDDTLPLTPPEWPEWGDPITDKAAFERIRAYSPYDNVAPQAYPPMLVLAGVSDPRVTYWEPAKWVAKLRTQKTDTNRLCLLTNMDSGHGGSAGRFGRMKEIALCYAFAVMCAGINTA